VDRSRTVVVVASGSWNSVLLPKTAACFVARLQTLAPFAIEFMWHMRCVVVTVLRRRCFASDNGDSASTQRGGYKIYEKL
jgi:hypothetical protein